MVERPSRVETGRKAEEVARLFLEQHGMEVLGCRQRTPAGELDIVGREGREMVFVEVKARSSTRLGNPEEALNPRKARKIRAAAGYWLATAGFTGPLACRFDLVAIHLDHSGAPRQLIRYRAVIE